MRAAWIPMCLVPFVALPATAGSRTQVTVFGASVGPTVAPPAGGTTYGGTLGALISEERELLVPASGELRLGGIAATAEPGSAQLRDLTDPALAITEQRFVPGAATPTEMIARHVGEPVTVVTTKGEVTGTLRGVDEHSIVLETGTGDARRVAVMRRENYVLDVRMQGAAADKASFAWRVATKKPGKHAVAVSYRADGLSWGASYVGVLDEAAQKIDFNAWATVRNVTGVTFDAAELVLVGPVPKTGAAPTKFTPAAAVKLGTGDSTQVPLIPAQVAEKVRSVVTYEAMPDPTQGYQTDAGMDCTSFNGAGAPTGKAEASVELDLASPLALPDGKLRLFRRKAGKVELVGEDPLRMTGGVVRIRIAANADIAGERHAIACNVDERARTIQEKIEVKVENRGAKLVEVLVREYVWRMPAWKIESEDRKGTRGGPQAQEYRMRIPPKSTQSVTYSVLYTW